MSQFDNVSVVKKANIYFDGKCVSHTVLFPDGTRKTVGIIFPLYAFFRGFWFIWERAGRNGWKGVKRTVE